MPMERVDRPGEAKSDWRKKKALMALRGALGSGLGARDAAALCVAGVFFFPLLRPISL